MEWCQKKTITTAVTYHCQYVSSSDDARTYPQRPRPPPCWSKRSQRGRLLQLRYQCVHIRRHNKAFTQHYLQRTAFYALPTFNPKVGSLLIMTAIICGRLDRLESALTVLLERSALKHRYVFCSLNAQTDGHGSVRFPNYRDVIARAVQVSRPGLYCRCLKAEHQPELWGSSPKLQAIS